MDQSDDTSFLQSTESICPKCLKVIEAMIVVQDKAVYLKKVCPDHGISMVYLWPDVDHYRWMSGFRFPSTNPRSCVPSLKGCPNDCGLCSAHLRQPTLVEIEITKRCNLRCPICFMAADEAHLATLADPDLLTIEGIYKNILVKNGSQISIQLTGGEPTTRKDLFEIVRLGKEIGFSAIDVNTNGVVIGSDPTYVQRLSESGFTGIYLQFDGLTRLAYEKIRGQDLLDIKLKAIENCREAGVQVALSVTVVWGVNHDQIGDLLDFALQNRDVIAGIAFQPAFVSGRFDVAVERRLTMGDVIFMLAEQSHGIIKPYDLWPLGGCTHPLCSCATYIVKEQDEFKPLTREITLQNYRDYVDPNSPQGSVFADIAASKFPDLYPGLSVVIMNYMDLMNIDLNRLKECSVTVAMPNGGFEPFCAQQLKRSFQTM